MTTAIRRRTRFLLVFVGVPCCILMQLVQGVRVDEVGRQTSFRRAPACAFDAMANEVGIQRSRTEFACYPQMYVIAGLPVELLTERARSLNLAGEAGVVEFLLSSSPALKASLQIGERLTYSVSWGGFLVAGQITTEVKARGWYFQRDAIPLEVQARTVGLVRTLLIEVDDQFISYVDPKKLLPFRAEKHIREGKRKTDSFTVFDQKRRSARLSSGRTFVVGPETRDIVSLLYYIRMLEFGDGKTYRLPGIHDRDRFTVHVKARNKAQVETPAGRFDAFEWALTFEEKKGQVRDDYRLRIWISDDERRLPVLMTSTPSFGEVRIELADIANSKGGGRTITDSPPRPGKTELLLQPVAQSDLNAMGELYLQDRSYAIH